MADFNDDGLPVKSAVRRSRAALTAIIVALAASNSATFWFYPDGSPPSEELEAVLIAAWAFQPLLFAIWTALGPGKFVTRLPLVIPCLVFVIAVPGLHRSGFDVERFEFILIVVAGMVMLIATTALLFVLRWFTGWRIEQRSSGAARQPTRIQFDIKYLLTLITLYAAALGTAGSLKFAPPNPSPFFGPDFFMHVVAIGGAALSAVLLPVVAVPLFVLHASRSRRFSLYSVAFWALMTSFMAAILTWYDGVTFLESVQFILLIQSGAIIVAMFAALALRWAGYRLTAGSPLQSPSAPTVP